MIVEIGTEAAQFPEQEYTNEISLSSQKYGFGIRDPRSGIQKNLFRILDSDSRVNKAPDPGSRIPDPDPQHCFLQN